jgi:ParB-like chromosome segregation protein Spo0J
MSNPPVSLKALAESKTAGITKATTFRVDPDLIQFEEGFNLRTENDELELHVDRLYRAMKAGAFIPPVDVSIENGQIVARDGHCRTRAARRLKQELLEFTLECRQLRGNEADALFHMLGTGSGGKPLSPLEQGIGYLRLTRMGMTPVQIATKLGVSRVTIDNGLTLAEAPLELQQMVANGEVSSTTAREAIRQGSEGVEALKSVVEQERKEPSKKGKKVTAKKLKGTKAEKKPKKGAKGKKGKAVSEPEALQAAQPVISETQVSIVIEKSIASATAEFLRAFGADDENLKAMASTLETVLL